MKKMLKGNISPELRKIRSLISRLRESVNLAFNQRWFFSLAESMPLSPNELYFLLEDLERDCFAGPDPRRLSNICDQLEGLCRYVRRFVLPELKEKLGISALKSTFRDRTSEQYIQAGFIAYVFPVNLQHVEALLAELRSALLLTCA